MRFCSASLLVFLALFSVETVFADPLILDLKSYKAGTQTIVNNAEEGGNLYLASNDPQDSLKNIKVTTGGNTYLLSNLTLVNSDGTPKKIAVSGGLTITTTNPDSITYTLTGYIYVITAQQAQDPLFGVYVITGSHRISLNGAPATTVILNTQLDASLTEDVDQPSKSTYVTNIQQTNNENIYFHWGIPAANWKQVNNKQFFTNPFNYTTSDSNGNPISTRLFFDHVEPLQVSLDYWYITSYGPVIMDMQNNYVASHIYNTTAVNTTGLLVSNSYLFEEHNVNFQLDPTRSRTVGTLISAYISLESTVNFIFSGNDGSFVQTFDNTQNATQISKNSQLSAQKLVVNSTALSAGNFYCQYFGISTDLPPVITSTTAPPVTASSGVSTGSTQAPGSPSTGPTLGTQSTVTASSSSSTVSTGISSSSSSTVSTVTSFSGSTVTTGIPGNNNSTTTTTTTVATTTKSVRSLSILYSIFVVISLFMF